VPDDERGTFDLLGYSNLNCFELPKSKDEKVEGSGQRAARVTSDVREQRLGTDALCAIIPKSKDY
jgi:hypothetical protein